MSPKHDPCGRARARTAPVRAVLTGLAVALLIPASGVAESAGTLVTELGMAVEQLRGSRQVPDPTRLEDIHTRLSTGLDVASTSIDRGALQLLLSEMAIVRGRSDEADRYLRKAADDLEDDHYADDLEATRARILELSGDDARADEAWEKWVSRHRDSALFPEVRLARVWNAIRRREPARAEARLGELLTANPWLIDESRVALASATISWLNGKPQEALATLGSGPHGAEEGYLAAVCLDAAGQTLPAAATYQEVANRFPSSPLRDVALFRKADIFRRSRAYQSAAEEFQRVRTSAHDGSVRSEATFRQALCLFLDDEARPAEVLLDELSTAQSGTDVGARAQVLLAELVARENRFEEAIGIFTAVLAEHFEHDLAPRAQYRIGRCLDALGRSDEATSSYMAVVEGYSQSPEAPAAAYLAGVGLLERDQPQAAVPHFQLLLDRYGERARTGIATDAERELFASARYHLLVSFRAAGDVSHVASAELSAGLDPGREDGWDAGSRLLIADALASQHRYADAQQLLEPLLTFDGDPSIAVAGGKLLSWVYAQQGDEDLAVETEQSVLERFSADGHHEALASAALNRGHMLFNGKRYEEAVEAYEEFARVYPDHPRLATAWVQAGICYARLDRAGDAVDRWERVVEGTAPDDVALNASTRAANVYFRAEEYEAASRHFDYLLARFPDHPVAARAMLGKAQCAYNQGVDDGALQLYSAFLERSPDSPLAADAEQGIEMALYRLGQQDDGLERLSQLVEDFPTSAFAGDAQYDIATRLYAEERFDESATAFRRLVSQFPTHPNADRSQFFMAEALAASGDLSGARGGYEQFLIFFPTSDLRTNVQFRLGSLRFDAGDLMRAAVAFTGVLGGEPDEETRQATLFNLALCERELGEADAALTHLQMLTTAPLVSLARADVEHQIGELHATSGRFMKAINHFETALAEEPSHALSAELNFRLGSAYEGLGDPARAIGAYEKAAEGEPTDFRVPALTRCALMYEESDDMRSALRVYRQLAKASSDPELVAAADQRAEELEAVVQ